MPVVTTANVLWFERELEYAFDRVNELETPPLNSFRFFDINTDVPAGAETYRRTMMTMFADAIYGGEVNVKDIPFANVGMKRDTFRTVPILNAFGWTIFELKKVGFAGRLPEPLRGRSARDGALRKHNDTFWDGAPQFGVWGLFNFPGLPRWPIPNAIDSTTTASTIATDLFNYLLTTRSVTAGLYFPNVLLMPNDEYAHIAITPRVAEHETTILEWVIEKSRGFLGGGTLQVEPVWELDSKNALLAFNRAPEKHFIEIPGGEMWEPLPVQVTKYGFEVYTYGFNGGFSTEYPLEFLIGTLP